jgi:hypothetical protein
MTVRMGRTIPSYRNTTEIERNKWKIFRERLDRKDRKEFDKMFSYSRLYNSAGSNACILISIIFEDNKQLEILKRSKVPKKNVGNNT